MNLAEQVLGRSVIKPGAPRNIYYTYKEESRVRGLSEASLCRLRTGNLGEPLQYSIFFLVDNSRAIHLFVTAIEDMHFELRAAAINPTTTWLGRRLGDLGLGLQFDSIGELLTFKLCKLRGTPTTDEWIQLKAILRLVAVSLQRQGCTLSSSTNTLRTYFTHDNRSYEVCVQLLLVTVISLPDLTSFVTRQTRAVDLRRVLASFRSFQLRNQVYIDQPHPNAKHPRRTQTFPLDGVGSGG